MIDVGSDLWRSSCPTSLLKQGYIELVAQDHVQTAFENPQRWRLYDHFGQQNDFGVFLQCIYIPYVFTVFPVKRNSV